MMEDLGYLAWLFGMTLLGLALIILLPVWIIPYLVYRWFKSNE